MKMASGTVKGLGAAVLAWFTYMDNTFTPLIWVLAALAAIDLFLNIHKEGQQFQKLGSMLMALGAPGFAAANLNNPELGKYLVAILCICYLQIVVPQIINKIGALTLSKDPKQNAADQAALIAKVEALAAQFEQQAKRTEEQAQNAPEIIKDAPEGGK